MGNKSFVKSKMGSNGNHLPGLGYSWLEFSFEPISTLGGRRRPWPSCATTKYIYWRSGKRRSETIHTVE
jgi:hypothetical protein